jgi:hypothetical protein
MNESQVPSLVIAPRVTHLSLTDPLPTAQAEP